MPARDTASEIGISDRALQNWLNLAEFRTTLADYRSRLVEQLLNRLATVANQAVTTLEDILTKESTADSNKIKAAVALLDKLITLRDQHDLGERLREIEEHLDPRSRGY